MTDVVVLLAVLAAAAAAAAWWRRRQGQATAADGQLDPSTLERLGVPNGKAGLLLFSAPACATCDAARSVLAEVADSRPDVAWAEASVADELTLARDQGVLRAPTVLLVTPDGAVRARFGGVPQPEALMAVVDG